MTTHKGLEIGDRFGNTEARVIGCSLGFPDQDCHFTLETYPWREHPLYLMALERGESYGFEDCEEGYRRVKVKPIGLHKSCLSPVEDILGFAFTRDHPILWLRQRPIDVICNSVLSMSDAEVILQQASKRLTARFKDAKRQDLGCAESMHNVRRWGHMSSFSLGAFPPPFFDVLIEVLDERGIGFWPDDLPCSSLPWRSLAEHHQGRLATLDESISVVFPEVLLVREPE